VKHLNPKSIKTTFAHNSVKRKQLVKPGDLKSRIQTVNYAWLEAGESFEAHKHDDCEEIFFIIEGGGEFKVDNNKFIVGPNDCIIIEKGEVHSLKNLYNLKLIFL
jgi:mannose-6-phosphate isomerase-like protein (cupin superfamily)